MLAYITTMKQIYRLSLALLVPVTLLLSGWHILGNQKYRQTSSLYQNTQVALFTAGIGPKYFELVERQMAATTKHFCIAQPYSIHNFVFTDQYNDTEAASNSSVTFVYKKSNGWPHDSEDRYMWFGEAVRKHDIAKRFKFALWMDSDNVIVEDTCEDLLGNLVALRHGWHPSAEEDFPYESNTESQAYVAKDTKFKHYYYSAHIFGGTVENFLHLSDVCASWTSTDHALGIQAAVDDESYLNRYFTENCPTVTLSYAYVYPEGIERPWSSTVKPMALAVSKNSISKGL